MRREQLQGLSQENHWACIKLQRTWRGHRSRRRLWAWGGVLMVSRVVKMQKVVRGWRGRRRALAKLKGFHDNCANRIKGSYFIWQAKKLLRILRAEFAQKAVLRLQCMYRMRLAVAEVRSARLKFHNYMGLKICRVARGYLGRRRIKAVRQRSQVYFQQMTATIIRDIQLAQSRVKISLQTLGPTTALTEWDWVECALFNLLGVNRRDFALDIATELVRRFPTFPIGHFVLKCVLFLTWTCSGSNQHVREDYLEELVGILYHDASTATSDLDDFVKAMPRERTADKTSHFASSMEEIEFMYFRNAFVRHGKSAVALASMAACVLMRARPEFFGRNPEENKAHRMAVARASNLLHRSKLVNTAGLAEAVSRVEIFESIFLLPHRVVETQRVTFIRCRMFGLEGFMQLHKQTRLNLKDSLATDVEVVQCGPDIFVIRSTFGQMPLTDAEIETMRSRNHDVTDDTELTPKWIIDYEDGTRCKAKIHIRPVILQSKEVKHLTDLAIQSHAKANGVSEDEARQTGVTSILAAYLLKEVRLVSCRSRLVASDECHELSSLRLVIPALDYSRREQNNTRTVDYSLKMMQRVYRGFCGKSRFRRLYARTREILRQSVLSSKKRMDLLMLREKRHKLAGMIQAKVRRFLWRRLMKKLHRAARNIQCCIRQKIARKRVAEKRRRRDMGPEVVMMLKRSITVGTLSFTLIIYRCGDNYRMAGHDLVNNAIYEGSLHRPEVIRLVEDYNLRLRTNPAKHKGQQRMYIYNYYRVAELIASQLGVATAMSAVSTALGAVAPGHKKLCLVAVPTANPSINNVEKITSLHRVLKDQAGVAERYQRLLNAKAAHHNQDSHSKGKNSLF